MAFDFTTAKERMQKAQDALQRELASIRAGRANPNLLNRVEVDYYGVPTPVNQLASVTTPEARVLLITPFDKTALDGIIQAIMVSDLGLNPTSDGNVVRLVIPQLTEDRRKELAKDVKAEGEKAKVAVRNIRRDVMDAIKKSEDLTEDDKRKAEEQAQKITDENIKGIDGLTAEKEKELLEI
ncbi:MAG TPA: ribosome recycling factor [Lactobacillaceae bacterium]|jgi:ribosome recycling factor